MALNYLLSPEFQIVNSAGRPASGGFLEVYVHGTREKYFCASDFDGTLHPFRVPLDSLGSNVVLASDAHAYDVYIYNRYGTLLMSRYNVGTSSGGAMGGVITSSDGSITVTPTVDGYDLSTRDNKASTLRAAAEPLYADGFYSFRKLEGEGESIYLDNGNIKLEDGWYHFSATVKLNWNGNIVPNTGSIRLYSGLTYDIVDFDYSYNHVESILLDGDIFIGAHSSHYISFGRNFTLGITGMPTGMVAELVDCDIHSIIGQGVGGGEKNIHRLLRYYTNANEADAQHPAGDWLHDLDAEDPADPSGHPMVTADELFAWYDEGQIFELYEVDGSNGQLGWSAVYRMVTWQDQSDWWSQFAPVPGKACRLEFYRMGGYSSINRGMMIAYIRYKEEDYMRLYQIMPGQDVWTMDFQPELTAGSNISISGSTISATDTTYTAGTGLSLTGTEFSADTSVLATQSDLAGKQDTLTAGSNITISNNVISATNTTYTAGTGIDITGDVISADTSVVATQSDLAGKQDTLTAGTGITIQNNVISASAAQQVQSNWAETDQSSVSYIQNKPDLSVYAETADLATVATTGDYDDLINKPSIPSFDSTQMAAINSGVNSTKVGDYDNHIADTTIHVTAVDKTTWNGKQDAISDLNDIRSGASAGATAVQPGDLATVATTGDYDDLINKPTIPTVDQVYDGTSTNAQSGTAVAGAISTKQDTISDLNTIRSGAQAGSTAVQPGDLATVATTGSYTDLTNKPDLSVYAETADLATVATTGSYNDLSNTPDLSVYAETADLATVATTGDYDDLINKPTIPAAQVNSDWNASSGVAEILNKPDLSVYATQNDLAGKQDTLTAGSNITISNNVISATDTTYSAGTGLSLNGTTFSNADPLPAHTSSDEGKILKVDSNGDLEWGAESGGTVTDVQVNGTSVVSGGVADITVPAQEQSDWTEADSSDPAFILHKPTEKTLAAGSNITITDLNDTVTISSTDTTYTAGSNITINGGVISAASQVQSDWSESDTSSAAYIDNKPDLSVYATTSAMNTALADKQDTLTAGANVSISNNVISATDTTYTAGTGIDISNNEISVETPVDIVAGPGIVIDNPDGNTLRVSTDENYEVELFSGTAANTNVVLNEALDNFERIKIYAYWKGTNTYEYYGYSVTEIYTSELSVGKRFTVNVFCNLNDSEFYSIANFSVASTKTQLNVVNVKRASLTEQLIAQNDGPTVYKVIGIHRIANN